MIDRDSDNPAAFDAWLDAFFAYYYARRPVNATFSGVHRHDHLLPDHSDEGRRTTVGEMRALRARLDPIPTDGLGEAQLHDRLLADGFLDIQLWEDGAANFHAGNPTAYTGEGVFSVISLFQRDSEPLAERVAAAISRMDALPAFLAQGRANVSAAPTAWTEAAIREANAGAAYFARGIPIVAEERGVDDPAFAAAGERAAEAFQDHAAWLAETLLPHDADGYACGREAFDRYLARGHFLPPGRDSHWVREYAETQLREAQDALERDARDLDPATPWRDQLATLADDHPLLADYYPAYTRVWNEARQAALDHDLVTWPDYPIAYVPVPRSDREAAPGLYYLWYRCPPPFGRAETHRYLVTPIEPEMAEEEREKRLRAASFNAIKLNHVVHHGGLGHHVQNWNAFRAESRVGRMAGVDCASRVAMSCSGTLIEGWACYATELMDEVGFLTPLEHLAERHQRVRMAARALVDVALHTGEFTLAEAAAFYVGETAMAEGAAKGEAVKNSMFPGGAMMYLIGIDGIRDLRARIQVREGDAFSLKRFHDRFLSYGAIPVSLIGTSMLAEG
ncbi:MAG: DUF885 family protein [Thermomicrobiales bacterium]